MIPTLILPPEVTDVHTHNAANASHAIVSRRFPHERLLPDAPWQSTGIHPWDADITVDWESFLKEASDARVTAIGEAGIDMLRGPSPEIQKKVLIPQIEIAEKLRKPLILHVVKAFHHILSIKRDMHPEMPWIIHGFRGKPQLAKQLVDAGLYLSLGGKYNPDILRVIPNEFILRETD